MTVYYATLFVPRMGRPSGMLALHSPFLARAPTLSSPHMRSAHVESLLDNTCKCQTLHTWVYILVLVMRHSRRLKSKFDRAQDIVTLRLAFYKGDERTRRFKVKTFDSNGQKKKYKFTSSGSTLGFEDFQLDSDETVKIMITPINPNKDDWISITEVSRQSFCGFKLNFICT